MVFFLINEENSLWLYLRLNKAEGFKKIPILRQSRDRLSAQIHYEILIEFLLAFKIDQDILLNIKEKKKTSRWTSWLKWRTLFLSLPLSFVVKRKQRKTDIFPSTLTGDKENSGGGGLAKMNENGVKEN